MNLKRLISTLMVGLMLAVQVPIVALADTPDPATTPTTTEASQTPTTDTTTPSDQPPADTTQTPTDNTQPSQPPAPPPADPSTGPDKPTGKAPDYAFNDATRKWEPTIISCFTWNAATGLWECPAFYTYDATVGWYHVKPAAPSDSVNALTAGSSDPSKTLKSILGAANDPLNANTGPNSTNNSSLNNTNNLLAQLINNISLSNFDTSTATTGDASVAGNNSGGSATTGAATVVKNLLNLLNAMWAWGGGGMNYFVNNLFGNHTGDLKLNVPTSVSGGGGSMGLLPSCPPGVDANDTTGPGSTNTATSNCQNNVAVNSQTNGTINNNVDLLAQSGNANVGGNTTGGDATSGDASAELNIVNLINSAIGAGQTFFGMLNIYGDLNGDILFPGLNLSQGVTGSPSASTVSNTDTGPGSVNGANANNTNNANITNTNNGTFNNNIQAAAASGAANTSGNTTAGNATTGDAQTNTNTFNLFNTSIFGDNAVLVLVNDMGHWVGRILNLGGGDSGGALLTNTGATVSNNNTGPGSNNQANSNNTNNLNVTNTTNGTINNTVHAGAVSGDANVSGNTIGGNARSGNASVASNIANIFGSTLSFKKVFGILVINIMPGAHWFGSVGIDTAAGNTPTPVTPLVTASTSSNQFATQAAAALAGSTANSNAQNSNITNNQVQVQATQQLHAQQAQAAASSGGVAVAFLVTAALLMAAAGLFSLDRRLTRK